MTVQQLSCYLLTQSFCLPNKGLQKIAVVHCAFFFLWSIEGAFEEMASIDPGGI
ncbi:MAG: hypothetical protein ACP5PZ_00735 [Bacteroidales bacterium]